VTTTHTKTVAPKSIPDLPADLEAGLRRLKLATVRRTAPEVLPSTPSWRAGTPKSWWSNGAQRPTPRCPPPPPKRSPAPPPRSCCSSSDAASSPLATDATTPGTTRAAWTRTTTGPSRVSSQHLTDPCPTLMRCAAPFALDTVPAASRHAAVENACTVRRCDQFRVVDHSIDRVLELHHVLATTDFVARRLFSWSALSRTESIVAAGNREFSNDA
jgi:hypothetical protein